MLMPDAQALVLLGLHHEQQHQELMLTDVQHLLSLNPLEPALYDAPNALPAPLPGPLHWIEGRQGLSRSAMTAKATSPSIARRPEIGRAQVCTPVTNAHLVCRLLLEKKNRRYKHHKHTS